MRSKEFITESPATELAKKLPGLAKHDYDTIDRLMQRIAKNHGINGKALHDLFVKKFGRTPDSWVTGKLDEAESDFNLEDEVSKFAEWTQRKLNIQNMPKFDLSQDTRDAQDNHHTGSHPLGGDTIWIYVKNRNLVDILRTVFHELVHVRQDELGMIEPGDSYPGSPIEVMADMLAGKWIKIYGEANHHIFQ
jgi:hypothetical protein